MNIVARLLLSHLKASDAPDTPQSGAASAGPAASTLPPEAAGYGGYRPTSELLRRSELWHDLYAIGSTLNEFDKTTLSKLCHELRDRAAQFEAAGD